MVYRIMLGFFAVSFFVCGLLFGITAYYREASDAWFIMDGVFMVGCWTGTAFVIGLMVNDKRGN